MLDIILSLDDIAGLLQGHELTNRINGTDVTVRCDLGDVNKDLKKRPEFLTKCMNIPSKSDRETVLIEKLKNRIKRFERKYGVKAIYDIPFDDQILLDFRFEYKIDGINIYTPCCLIMRSCIDPFDSLEKMLKTVLNNNPNLRTREEQLLDGCNKYLG